MNTETRKRNYFLETVTAVIVAVIISLVLLLVAALLIGFLSVDDNYLPVINQIIKGVSVFFACLICLKRPNNRWIRGFFVGLLYTLAAFFIFSAMANNFSFGLSFVNDVAIGAAAGLLSGVVAGLLRK